MSLIKNNNSKHFKTKQSHRGIFFFKESGRKTLFIHVHTHVETKALQINSFPKKTHSCSFSIRFYQFLSQWWIDYKNRENLYVSWKLKRNKLTLKSFLDKVQRGSSEEGPTSNSSLVWQLLLKASERNPADSH
jgi:hypothetical protein